MATNTRRKNKSNTEEQEVTVTDEPTLEEANTTEEVAEVAEAVAGDSGKVTSQSEVPAEEILFEAIKAFASDGNREALQNVYRTVHASTRARAQGVAMKRALVEGVCDAVQLGDVLDAFNNLPTTTKARVTKPQVDEGTQRVIRLAGIASAFESLRQEFGDEAYNAAIEWVGGSLPTEYTEAVERVSSNVVAASGKRTGRGGGARTSISEKLSDLIERGALPVGAVLKGANGAEATVMEDGTLETAGQRFKSPSGAAKAHRTKEDGEQTSTNGWDFWTYEDKPIGLLRNG